MRFPTHRGHDPMLHDSATQSLYDEICSIPLIDPHSHINPHRAAARSPDWILGYHYYTELAHSAGMDKAPLAADADPRERVRAILTYSDRFDNTVQFSWFLEIARAFLGYEGERLTAADTDWLISAADKAMARPNWEAEVQRRSNREKIIRTNSFDSPLEGFDTSRYVPCLRVDDLIFGLRSQKEAWQRLERATGFDGRGGLKGLAQAIAKLFEHFTKKGARACAVSLPPDFVPEFTSSEAAISKMATTFKPGPSSDMSRTFPSAVFAILSELCRDFKLPFDLMIGVNRRVYREGVYQGQDLFDQRTSLFQYAELFNAFPDVTFSISVLSSGQNQELVSYSWIFPNVVTHGHWWYSNIPAYIESDLRARLQAVPKTKQIGYYSDA